MSRLEITKSDREAFDKLPQGWFEIHQVDFSIRSPRWRCDRLVARGLLESKVTVLKYDESAFSPGYKTLYRRTKTP